jgi:hypothetical protein
MEVCGQLGAPAAVPPVDPTAGLDVLEKRRNSCLGTRLLIKYQYSYMSRPREVIIRLALEHFERNVQIALLEMRAHFCICTISVFLSNTFKLLV